LTGNHGFHRAGSDTNNSSFNKPSQQLSAKPLSPEEVVAFFAKKYKLSLIETRKLMDSKLCLICKKSGHSAKICRSRPAVVGLNMFAELDDEAQTDDSESKN
jgi:hypothetical protein